MKREQRYKKRVLDRIKKPLTFKGKLKNIKGIRA